MAPAAPANLTTDHRNFSFVTRSFITGDLHAANMHTLASGEQEGSAPAVQ